MIREIVRHLGTRPEEMYFWATHAGAELDLVVLRGNRRLGFEVKRTTTPTLTRSMRSAVDTLKLDSLDVIHAGEHTFDLGTGVRAVSFGHMFEDVKPL